MEWGVTTRTGTRIPTQEVSRARVSLELDVEVAKQEEETFLVGACVMGGPSFRNPNIEGRMMNSVSGSVHRWCHDDIPVEVGSEGTICRNAETRVSPIQMHTAHPRDHVQIQILTSKYLVGPRNLHF